jgi:hypothetical protein
MSFLTGAPAAAKTTAGEFRTTKAGADWSSVDYEVYEHLLEAELSPARRIADRAVHIELPSASSQP